MPRGSKGFDTFATNRAFEADADCVPLRIPMDEAGCYLVVDLVLGYAASSGHCVRNRLYRILMSLLTPAHDRCSSPQLRVQRDIVNSFVGRHDPYVFALSCQTPYFFAY